MFLEPHFRGQRSGWMEVICGCMFSGKTEELIRRLKRAKIARQNVRIFKPARDDRYDEEQVVSHDENALIAQPLKHSEYLLEDVEDDIDVIGIDETQFFDDMLPEVCEKLVMRGKRVILAGLDMDYRGRPFGPMPRLLAIAEYITKVHAICKHCGSLANFSYRLVPSDKQVLVGEQDKYEARCRTCFHMGNILDFKGGSGDEGNMEQPE